MTDASWAQKVMSYINSNEEGTIGRFGDKLHTELKRSIRNMNRWIGDKLREIEGIETQLADKLEDMEASLETLRDNYSNSFYEVKLDRLKTAEKMNDYVHVFLRDLQRNKNLILDKEQEIEDVKESYQDKINAIKEAIECKKEDIKLQEEFLRNI